MHDKSLCGVHERHDKLMPHLKGIRQDHEIFNVLMHRFVGSTIPFGPHGKGIANASEGLLRASQDDSSASSNVMDRLNHEVGRFQHDINFTPIHRT